MLPSPQCPRCNKVMEGGQATYDGDLIVNQGFVWSCRDCKLEGRVMDSVNDRRHKIGNKEELEGKNYELTTKVKEGPYIFLFYRPLDQGTMR